MAGFGLSGLASGVDTSGIVDQLMAIERQSLSRFKLKQSRLDARDAGLKDIQAKLAAFKSAAAALRAPDLWGLKQTVETSNAAIVGATVTGGAGIGGTTIIVQGLASSTQRTLNFTQDPAARTLTLTPTDGTKPPVTLNIAANATLNDVVALINGRTDVPVFAAAVTPNGGGPPQLVLSSRTTGAGTASNFTVSGDAAVEDPLLYKAGTNARYRLNGSTTTLQSPTNVVENAIPGVTLTLKATNTAAVSLTVSEPTLDREGLKTKVKAFVEAYNAVVTTARGKITEKTVPDAATAADANKGQLFGDYGISSMLSGLRTAVADLVGGNPATTDALADLGISTGAIGAGKAAASGTLVLDEAKLMKAIETDPPGVRKLLGGVTGSPGIAQRFEELVDRQIGATGAIDQRLKGSVDEKKRIGDAMERTETRLEAREKRLRAQFAAMESALQASQTQQAWLSGQLATLNSQTR